MNNLWSEWELTKSKYVGLRLTSNHVRDLREPVRPEGQEERAELHVVGLAQDPALGREEQPWLFTSTITTRGNQQIYPFKRFSNQSLQNVF